MSTNQTTHARKRIENYSYSLVDVIGSGYSSKVYRGRQQLPSGHNTDSVALKVIDMKALKNDVHKTLLMNQIDCLRQLRNSNYCIQMLDVYTTKNNTYIITQFCKQGDLAKLIQSKGPIPQEKALQIMQQIVKGYLQIQNKGIIHRDLKPANIFLNGKCKLADFGFAIKTTSDQPTRFNYNVGSPLYMPPQALSSNLYSYKSDIWALGVIFFQLLTSKTPWVASTQKELQRAIKNDSIQYILPLGLSYRSITFLKKCLQPKYQDRMSPTGLSSWLHLKQSKTNILHPSTSSKQLKPLTSSTNISTNKPNIYNEQMKIILSHVHYGRFMLCLGQLISKLTDTKFKEIQMSIASHMTEMIRKLQSMLITKCNSMRLSQFDSFINSAAYDKVLSIVQKYANKFNNFKVELYAKFNIHYESPQIQTKSNIKTLQQLAKQMAIYLLSIVKGHKKASGPVQSYQMQLRNYVIVLDYLITFWQLLQIQCWQNPKQFYKQSQIQKIMRGKPNQVTSAHLDRIFTKMQKLRLV